MVLFYQIRSFYVIDDAVPSQLHCWESNRGDSKSKTYIKIRSYFMIDDAVPSQLWAW